MVDDLLEEKIEKMSKTLEEDHKMIKSMYVRARIGFGLKIFYWTVIIAAAIGSYYVIQPYFEKLQEIYDTVKTTKDSINSSPFIEFFKASGDKNQTQ